MPGETRVSRIAQLALAVAQGHSIVSWARQNNVPERTAYRWAADINLRRDVQTIRRRYLDQAVGRMAEQATWAADQIVDLGKNAESESVKLRALRAILSDMMTVSQFATLEERMAEVEEHLRERDQAASAGRSS
jgi:hypothetical protein